MLSVVDLSVAHPATARHTLANTKKFFTLNFQLIKAGGPVFDEEKAGQSCVSSWSIRQDTSNILLMTQLSHCSELDAMVVDLVATIDAHSSDYPVVSFRDKASGPDLIWLYARLVIEVFVDNEKPVSIRSRVPGGVSIYVKSLQQGLELLRETEGFRQQVELPYIRLR